MKKKGKERAPSFAEQTSSIDDPSGPMPIRLLTESAGFRTRIAAEGPTVVLPLESSLVEIALRAQTHAVDRSTWLLVPAGGLLGVTTKSPTATVLVLGISSDLMNRVAATYRGEVETTLFEKYVRSAVLLPRTNWVNEIAHRYLFERAVCKKKTSDATRFLETEIAKEVYFLCREQHDARERPTLVEGRSDVMARALAYVEAHLFEPDLLANLAKACGASPSTLLRAFRRDVGDGPLGYVRARRLDEALLLLKSRRHSVGEIAARVGYTNLPAFSQAFRARFGLRPSDVLATTTAKSSTPPAGVH